MEAPSAPNEEQPAAEQPAAEQAPEQEPAEKPAAPAAPEATAAEAAAPKKSAKKKTNKKKTEKPKNANAPKAVEKLPKKIVKKIAKKVAKQVGKKTGGSLLVRKRPPPGADKDSLNTRSSAHRFALRHGGRRVSGNVVAVLRQIQNEFRLELLKGAVEFMRNARRKGVRAVDVQRALRYSGETVYGM